MRHAADELGAYASKGNTMTMRFHSKVIFFVCSGFLLGAAETALAQCDQTLSPGANVASAVSNAATGTTICLSSGDYGSVDFSGISRSGFVTLRSASGVGARMSPKVSGSRFIRFQSMTIAGSTVNNCSLNIEFVKTPFAANGSGLLIDGSACPSSTHNHVVDGATFDEVGQALYEGRLNCRDCNGVTVKNSSFSGASGRSPADGIQTQGNTRNFTIGPGNRFRGIKQAACGSTHCDSIQFQGGGSTLVTGNLFEDADVFIMSPDGCSNVTVENNVFNGAGMEYQYKLQFGSCSKLTFRHNTLRDAGVAIDSKNGERASSDALVENNILLGFSNFKTSNGAGCSNCTFRSNLFDSSGDARGTYVTGTPTFVGGSLPTAWAGWQIASGSVGDNAGSDGKDMGTLYYGSGTPAPTEPPPTPDPTPDPAPTPTPEPPPPPAPTPTPEPPPAPTPTPTAPAPPTGLRVIR
jgi:hypothetical protein